jgi:2-desacetyl-2-hydroxyethyl bacteriochlorophyllide A dehydrogenase
MSEYFVVPERAVVPLPAGLDPADASLVETTAIGWHACRLADVGPEQRVAVVGGGALGLLAAVAARAAGATDVAITTRHPHQREAAERLGFDAPTRDYDVVLEAAGSESALDQATKLVRKGGMVAVMGVFGPETKFPYMRTLMKELRTVSSLGYCRHDDRKDFEDAAAILAADPEIVDTVISHRFPLEDAPEAFRVAADKSSGALKVVVQP